MNILFLGAKSAWIWELYLPWLDFVKLDSRLRDRLCRWADRALTMFYDAPRMNLVAF